MSEKDCQCGPEETKVCDESGERCDCVMPEVDFSTFILSLSSSGMVHLGEVPDPETGQSMKNLAMAKHTIDIIAMLKKKVVEGLTPEEERLIDGVLYELRMAFIKQK